MMEVNIFMENGHYVLSLPFRKSRPDLPNNRVQALKRANSIKKKMIQDGKYCDD